MDQPNPASVSAARARAIVSSGLAVTAVLFAIALSSTESLTAPAALLVTGAGVALGASWFLPARGDPCPPAATGAQMALWAGLAAAFCGWEVAALRLGDNYEFPTFSKLADPVLAHPGPRAVAALAWVAWGWRLSLIAREATEAENRARA
ncbi:MAG: hypothetical protein AB1673_10425 [Actinomycetota bacterium]|jgi:hypothetical protein